MNEDILLQ